MKPRRWTTVLAAASVMLLLGAPGLLAQAKGNPHGPPPGRGPHHGPPAIPPGLHDRTPPPGKPFGGEPPGHHYGRERGRERGRGHGEEQGREDGEHHSHWSLSEKETAAVTAASGQVGAQLAAGSLRPQGGAAPSAEVQHAVRGLLTGNDAAATARVRAALLSHQNRNAGPEAADLVDAASGLLSDPGGLPDAIEAQNALVRASSRDFLADPPPEFVALHAALAELVAAAGGEAGDGTRHP